MYSQLPGEVRQSYHQLTAALDSRYRKVESARSYGARFSHRDQKPQEAAEEYAAELKQLYDKAYPKWATQTWKEDLMWWFLDGLRDELQARFQVEFVKEPLDIDTAVYEVVAFQEAKYRPCTSDWAEKGTGIWYELPIQLSRPQRWWTQRHLRKLRRARCVGPSRSQQKRRSPPLEVTLQPQGP